MGVIYLNKLLFDYAKEEFEKAYELEPDDFNITFEYANYLHATTEFEKADEMYQKALVQQPENPNALAFSALNKVHLKQYETAREQIDKALKMANDQPFLLFIAGRIRFLLKEFEDAKMYLVKSYEIDKNDETENLLGLCYMELKNYEQALNIFKHLLEKNNANINVLLNIAKCHKEMNQNDLALQTAERITEILPDCEDALEMIRELS